MQAVLGGGVLLPQMAIAGPVALIGVVLLVVSPLVAQRFGPRFE